MASSIKIKVNGLMHGVTREPRYAAAVRPAQRAPSARPALRLRPGAVWCLLGAAGRQGDPLLCDAGGGGEREGDHDARGPAGSVCEVAWHDGGGAGVASVAAGVDRRAGAALRLLPERDDDPGRRSAGDDEEPDRGSDPHGDERPSLPLRHLSADPDGDPEGRRGDGEGREVAMTGLTAREGVLAQVVRQGRRRADRRLLDARAGLAGKASAAGTTRTRATAVRPVPDRLVDHRSTPTTRRRSRRAGSGRARGRIPGC